MNVVAAALKNIYDRRENITKGLEIIWESELLRHFTVEMKRID